MNILFQDIFALVAILSSLLVITSKNPVISVLFLISVFINSALYLILSGITFVGISYIIIYVGAIAILFLFILMMINIKLTDILELGMDYTKNLPLALVIGSLFILSVFTILPFSFQDVSLLSGLTAFLNYSNSLFSNSLSLNSLQIHITYLPFNADTYLIDFTQIEALGHNLYTHSSVLFILTSLILLLSMLSPIILSSRYNPNNN
jgi:NADH-ubiquinone oxidoreductase chain 6